MQLAGEVNNQCAWRGEEKLVLAACLQQVCLGVSHSVQTELHKISEQNRTALNKLQIMQ